ncbi:aconitase X [Chloroflexota bacterium]
MRLNEAQERILDGKAGSILQQAMLCLIKYGTAMGAEEFIPISSAHTLFKSMKFAAQIFSPPGAQLTEAEIFEFGESLARLQMKARTTTNATFADLDKWRQMGADEATYKSVKQAVQVAGRCGILPTCSCTPYLMYNIPQMGEHCSWSESSALIYANAMLGARTNRDGSEVSFSSGLLGITPKFGMHLDENRKGTHLIDVQCEIDNLSDWGVLGWFAGEVSGVGAPVFTNLRRPTVEEAKQLGASINTPGATAIFHIVGVTPEAPTVEAAFGENVPKGKYTFDESAKRSTYEHINLEPDGKVGMVCIGCPFCTLSEVKEVARLIEGKQVAKDTKLWVLTDYPTRSMAEWLGYAQIIYGSGGEIIAGGCPSSFNNPAGRVGRMATNSAKLAYYAKTTLGNNVFLGDTARCIDIATKGGA